MNATQPVQAVNGTLPATNLTAPAAPFQNQTGFTSTLISTAVTDVTTTISLADSVVTSVLHITSTHTVFVHYTATGGGAPVPVSTAAMGAAPAGPNGNNALPTPNGEQGSEPTTTVANTDIVTRTATVTRTRAVDSAGSDQQKGVGDGNDDSATTTTVDVTFTQTTTVNPAGTAATANNNAAAGCGGGAVAAAAAPSVVTVTDKATVTKVRNFVEERETID